MSLDPNAQWFFARAGVQNGPFDLATLHAKLAAGQLYAHDLVWCDGMPAWTPVSDVPAVTQGAQNLSAAYPAQAQTPYPQSYASPVTTPNYATPPTSSSDSQQGMAIAGLVLAVIPVFPMPLLGFIFSMIALKAMKRTGNFEGKGLATAGAIVGGILTGLVCVAISIWIIFFVLIVGSAAAGAH